MPSPIAEVLAALAACFEFLGVRWYLFGAQAAIYHGVARLTADVDVTILPEPRSTPELAAALEANGFHLRATGTDDHTRTRMPVDIVLGGPGIEEQLLQGGLHLHPLVVQARPGPEELGEVLLDLQVDGGAGALRERAELPLLAPLLHPERDEHREHHHQGLGGELRELPAHVVSAEGGEGSRRLFASGHSAAPP